MEIKSYLDRIGVDILPDKNPVSLEFLTELQNRHLLSVPFEDLDIPKRRIELDLEKFYDKIINLKRGGFCYELNGLFHWLLISLGFKTDILSAHVFNSKEKVFGPEFDHMTLLVHSDKKYLVDVGFGDSFRIPIEIPDGSDNGSTSSLPDAGGIYRISKIKDSVFDLMKLNEAAWEPQYRFSTVPRELSDFKMMCDFQQDSPSSHFRTRMLCTIATPTGRITLGDYSLTVTEGELKRRTVFENPEEFKILLKKYFNIDLSE